jgi:hypothetical protein
MVIGPPRTLDGAPGDGVVEFEFGFGQEEDGDELDSAALVDGDRPFSIACPARPPTRPAMSAMKRPINASIHQRIHPLRAGAGATFSGGE